MAQSAYDLLVRIEASTAQLRAELNSGERGVSTFTKNVNQHLSGLDKSFAALNTGFKGLATAAGALGISLGAAGLLQDSLALADQLQDTSAQLGVSTDALQTYRFAAEETGVEIGTMESAILRLNSTIGEAASGNDAAIRKFEQLGIAFVDGSGKARSAEAVLSDLADVVRRLPTPAEQAAAATLLLGDRAARLVPLLRDGAQGLRDFEDAARAAGQVMEAETIERLANAQRAIERFKTGLTIATGEVLGFLGSLQAPTATVERLATVTREVEATKRSLEDLRDGGVLSDIAKAMGAEEEATKRLNRLLEEQRTLIDALAPGRTKDDTMVQPPVEPLPKVDTGKESTMAHAAATRELTSALEEMNARMNENLSLIPLEARARAEATAVLEGQKAALVDYNNGLRDSPILTETEIESLKQLSGALYDAAEARRQADAAARNSATTTQDMSANVGLLTSAYDQLGFAATTALTGLITGTTNAKGALVSLLNSLASGLLQLAFSGGGAGSGWSGVFAGLGNLIFGTAVARQHGGRVSASMPYIVGESGPELLVPDAAGTIVPSVPQSSLRQESPSLHFEMHLSQSLGPGGTPAQNRDLAERASDAMERSARSFVESTIALHMRDRGMFKPNVVG